jgi:hypothetical protein
MSDWLQYLGSLLTICCPVFQKRPEIRRRKPVARIQIILISYPQLPSNFLIENRSFDPPFRLMLKVG